MMRFSSRLSPRDKITFSDENAGECSGAKRVGLHRSLPPHAEIGGIGATFVDDARVGTPGRFGASYAHAY
jgi:hypothetical protein